MCVCRVPSQPSDPGVYECNPPFDNASACACFLRVGALLAGLAFPLSVVVVLPTMDFSSHLADAWRSVERFCRRTAHARTHVYKVGLQHRRTGDGPEGELHWRPEKDSVVYFLQNDAGVAEHPISDELVQTIIDAFDY